MRPNRREIIASPFLARIVFGTGVLLSFANLAITLWNITHRTIEYGNHASSQLPMLRSAVVYSKKRILLGIMSADLPGEIEYRKQFRQLFGIFDAYGDSRLCSLAEFRARPADFLECELVYTFVLGGNPNGPTELVNSSMPILVPEETLRHSDGGPEDKLMQDMSFLNIKENMEDGKSQTWFYLAQQLIQEFQFDYAAKSDSDSILNLSLFFEFSAKHLPPAPYNQGIIAGKPCDKLWWRNWRTSPTKYPPHEKKAKEGFLRERYGNMGRWTLIFHLYALGQFYLFSPDLVDTIVEEAASGNATIYIEGVEDHDITTMAFRSNKPIHFIFLSKEDMQFWDHGTKITKREKWESLWKKAKEDLSAALSLAKDEPDRLEIV